MEDVQATAETEDTKAAQPTGTEGTGAEPDYKALYEEWKGHARKWEEQAKANAKKARAYDGAQADAKTVEERLKALEDENTALKAEAERKTTVKAVADETGVPESLVSMLSGTDAETLTEQAKAIADAYAGGASTVPVIIGGEGKAAASAPKADANDFLRKEFKKLGY